MMKQNKFIALLILLCISIAYFYCFRILPLKNELWKLQDTLQSLKVTPTVITNVTPRPSLKEMSITINRNIWQSEAELTKYEEQINDGSPNIHVELTGNYGHLLNFLDLCDKAGLIFKKYQLSDRKLSGDIVFTRKTSMPFTLLKIANPFCQKNALDKRHDVMASAYPLQAFKMKAYISNKLQHEAWLLTPDNLLQRVHLHDCIAKEHACVTAIDAAEITFKLTNQHFYKILLS